jgi:peptidoglycan/xylan/chitin deacetylase (PgdA/CDA1 family)
LLRQTRLLTTMVVGVAMTVLVLDGCSSDRAVVGPAVQNQSSNTPTRVPLTEPMPKPQTSYPKFSTAGLVPEIYSVPQGDVAITIDDGPSSYTDQIIAVLKRFGVHATFFFIGDRLKMYPNAVRDAVNAGDVVGNHSETHPLMTDLSLEQQQQQIETTEQQLKQYGDPSPMFYRPPYGAFNNVTEQILSKDHLILALWNRDPRDWATSSPQQVIDAVVNGNPSGGIFDMHDNRVTLEALPTIIQTLQQRGLHFVVLGEVPTYSYVSISSAGSGSGSSSSTGFGSGTSSSAGSASGSGSRLHASVGSHVVTSTGVHTHHQQYVSSGALSYEAKVSTSHNTSTWSTSNTTTGKAPGNGSSSGNVTGSRQEHTTGGSSENAIGHSTGSKTENRIGNTPANIGNTTAYKSENNTVTPGGNVIGNTTEGTPKGTSK